MSNYNRVIDYKLTNDGTIVEPVTLAEAKLFCRITTGTTEDNLITEFITEAREAVEKLTGLCLVARTVKVVFNNPSGYFELPYGPVKESPAPVYKDCSSVVITPIVIGYDYPVIVDEFASYATAEYSSGFTTIPKELKDAIESQVAFLYENRGDNSDTATVCVKTQKICQRYSRIPFIN